MGIRIDGDGKDFADTFGAVAKAGWKAMAEAVSKDGASPRRAIASAGAAMSDALLDHAHRVDGKELTITFGNEVGDLPPIGRNGPHLRLVGGTDASEPT